MSDNRKHENIDSKWYVKGTSVDDPLGIVNQENGPRYQVAFNRGLFLNKLASLESDLRAKYPGRFQPESPGLWVEERIAYFKELGESVWEIAYEVWKAQGQPVSAQFIRLANDTLVLPILTDRRIKILEIQQALQKSFPTTTWGGWVLKEEIEEIEGTLLRPDIRASELVSEAKFIGFDPITNESLFLEREYGAETLQRPNESLTDEERVLQDADLFSLELESLPELLKQKLDLSGIEPKEQEANLKDRIRTGVQHLIKAYLNHYDRFVNVLKSTRELWKNLFLQKITASVKQFCERYGIDPEEIRVLASYRPEKLSCKILPNAPKPKRGPRANMEFHRAVADIAKPYGVNWRELSNLEKIVVELDKAKILTPPLKNWTKADPPARSWKRAFEYYPVRVIHSIKYALKMAARISG